MKPINLSLSPIFHGNTTLGSHLMFHAIFGPVLFDVDVNYSYILSFIEVAT